MYMEIKNRSVYEGFMGTFAHSLGYSLPGALVRNDDLMRASGC